MYEAYDGEKVYVQVDPWRKHPEIKSGKYNLMVIDEYPTETPGRAILIWHGMAGGKSIGLEQPHPYYRRQEGNLITRHVISSTYMVGITAYSDGIPENRIVPLGLPRTDMYFGRKKGDGNTFLANKRSYLYVPTYRASWETFMPGIDWIWLDSQLTDDEVIVIKVHPMSRPILRKKYVHIVEVEPSVPTAPYLMDCDVVISDYSTVIFDGYLLEKPAVLFEKEKGYTETRGMQLNYPEQYSSRYCTNERDLLKMLREADGLNAKDRECLRLVADACDGHSTERVCELIREFA